MSDTFTGDKPWYQSKTIWGSLLVLVSLALEKFGIQLDEATLQEVLDAAVQLGQVIGAIIAIWGRFKAQERVRAS